MISGNDSTYGGGASYNCLMMNCSIMGNTAGYGGGAYDGCTLYNCRVSGNTAYGGGGGAHSCTLYNCTVSGNNSGSYSCRLYNSIIYYNSGNPTQDIYGCTLNFCCAQAATDAGNITNAPLFVNSAGGNYRLQTNSPCINAGSNAYAPAVADFDGNPRIIAGTVDMGAYEVQTHLVNQVTGGAWTVPDQFGGHHAGDHVDGNGCG